MNSSAYCTSCGAERAVGKPFCTSCGERHAEAPRSVQTATPTVAQPAPSPTRQLRCVECSSPIDAGLVCARCAGLAATTPPTDPTPRQPRTSVQSAPAPKAEESFGKRALAVVLSIAVVVLIGFTKAGVKHGLAAAPEILSHRNGLDGTYVWQSAADASTWSRIRIDGERATVSDSTGWEDSGKVERTGDTIRFANDLTSSSRAAADPSKVDLARLVQDGQAIEMDVDGYTMHFVKQ